MYIAHRSEDARDQLLIDHLQGVSRLAGRFAESFDAASHACAVGQIHDLGKYSKEGQARQRDPEHTPKVDHATAGAWELFQKHDIPGALAVAGHHGGLPDLGNPSNSTGASLWARMNRARRGNLKNYSAYQEEIALLDIDVQALKRKLTSPLSMYFYTKMLYSCLVDADFLDTEAFMQTNSQRQSPDIKMEALAQRFDLHITNRGWLSPQRPLDEVRARILRQCMEHAAWKPGMFQLTVPTGGGKTGASMAFALHHAERYGKQRIIYVIPYTSIIEQNADEFAKMIGRENVLEHHSNFEPPEDEYEAKQISLATENWDAPVIVTTAVQFFESLFAHKSSKCRKLHHIANSVIIFDEAQMLPLQYLRPCVAAIAELVSAYECSAVLCTATQPALDDLFREFHIASPVPLITDASDERGVFRRVTFQTHEKLEDHALVEMLRNEKQVLCIVNSRRHAQRLYAQLENQDGSYHLSTLMTPNHRTAVLKEIRKRLKNGQSCRVISTSLIEAGVDIDFPAVFRAEAGLDSILQAAGRCNREGKRAAEESVVHVFCPELASPQLFAQNIAAMQFVMKGNADYQDMHMIEQYFRFLLKIKGEELDTHQILKAIFEGIGGTMLPFRQISEKFRLIDRDTYTVFIPTTKNTEQIDALRQGNISRTALRALGKDSVEIYQQHFMALVNAGYIQPLGDGGGILGVTKQYTEKTGLQLEPEELAGLFI